MRRILSMAAVLVALIALASTLASSQSNDSLTERSTLTITDCVELAVSRVSCEISDFGMRNGRIRRIFRVPVILRCFHAP